MVILVGTSGWQYADWRGRVYPADLPQRQWLEKIGNQLKLETVMDRDAFEQGLFKSSGGFARHDKTFDGKLAEVLGEIGDAIWQDVG